jgi:hypothetical protein
VPSPGTTYSLEDSDRELLISVFLNGTQYSALTTSLLAQSHLTVQQVEDALKNEEPHCLGVTAAVIANPAASPAASPAAAAPVSSLSCAFCGKDRHSVERCFKFRDASTKAKEEVTDSSKRRCPRKGNVHTAQDAQTPSESAGAASVHPVSLSSSLPNSWNADTWATSHMTPH